MRTTDFRVPRPFWCSWGEIFPYEVEVSIFWPSATPPALLGKFLTALFSTQFLKRLRRVWRSECSFNTGTRGCIGFPWRNGNGEESAKEGQEARGREDSCERIELASDPVAIRHFQLHPSRAIHAGVALSLFTRDSGPIHSSRSCHAPFLGLDDCQPTATERCALSEGRIPPVAENSPCSSHGALTQVLYSRSAEPAREPPGLARKMLQLNSVLWGATNGIPIREAFKWQRPEPLSRRARNWPHRRP
jgi:hypothetical protein